MPKLSKKIREKKHVKATYIGLPLYYLSRFDVCSKKYFQVRHVVQFHHGYRPYKCLLCSEGAYTDKRKMMNHLLNVHNIVNDQLNNNKEVRKASYEFHSKPPFNVDPIPKDMYFIA